MSLPPSNEEERGLLPPPPEEDLSSDDCCSFWFCLGTSKDEQAKIIQTSCSCSESDVCSHKHRRFHSSYDSFTEYNPHYGQNPESEEVEPVSRNGAPPQRERSSMQTNSRDSPTILQPSIHNTNMSDDDATA